MGGESCLGKSPRRNYARIGWSGSQLRIKCRLKLAQINPFVEPVFLKTEMLGALGVFGAVNQSQVVRFV